MDEQKLQVGTFLIAFEHICNEIRNGISLICYPDQLSVHQKNIETLLEGLTADPLRKKFEAIVYDNNSDREKVIEYNKIISNRFSELIIARNKIAHGTITPVYDFIDDELHPTSFILKKIHHSKAGTKSNMYMLGEDSLERIINQTYALHRVYMNFIPYAHPLSSDHLWKSVEELIEMLLIDIDKIKLNPLNES